MSFEANMILSIPQIRLCMRVLGLDTWDDLPLIVTQEAPEQRIVNAFLDLVNMGLMIPENGKYRMEPTLRERMKQIGGAGKTYHLSDGQRILAFLYESDDGNTLLSPDWGKTEYCRISSFSGLQPVQICALYASSLEWNASVRLQEAQERESGEYDLEKLAYFFGMNEKPEDNQ